jgi:hypothetical protein
MTLDTRSKMAINLVVNMGLSPHESFRTLAGICKSWGMDSEESIPIALELRTRLGLDNPKGAMVIRSLLDSERSNPN